MLKQLELEKLLLDLEARMGIAITVRDNHGLLYHPDGRPMLERISRHAHPYCKLGRRKGNAFDDNCMRHCAQHISERLNREKKIMSDVCWKGVQEMIIPVFMAQRHLLTFFVGAFRPSKEPDLSELSSDIQLAQRDLPRWNPNKIAFLKPLITLMAQGLLQHIADQKQRKGGRDQRVQEIRRFFIFHAHEKVRLSDLAETLNLSSTRCSHLVKELFDQSFQDMLQAERVRRAKSMLINSSDTLAEISEKLGFVNEYYFSRVFKKSEGISPGQYRKGG